MPSFIAWNSASRSDVSSRSAVSVMSFSGSVLKNCYSISQCLRPVISVAYITLHQRLDDGLHALAFAQQALIDADALQPALAGAHVIHLGVAVRERALRQVLGVHADVAALRLHCEVQISACSLFNLNLHANAIVFASLALLLVREWETYLR